MWFNRLDWNQLELSARSAVIAGGFSAMGYYRGALADASVLGSDQNPATEADVQSTLAIIRSLDPVLRVIAARNNYGLAYFAEELESASNAKRQKSIDLMINQLSGIDIYVKRTQAEFVASFDNSISVLFDSIDGTSNFSAGIPFFCSAIAFFIRGKPRVGAIYDPHHNVVYYGSLRGSEAAPEENAYARMWQVQSGNSVNLFGPNPPARALLGTHLTRSNQDKRQEFMRLLDPLSQRFEGGTYMLNCGQLALAYVASGSLAAFVNNHTNSWDAAAGQVLIRAIGGYITDFRGKEIDYRSETSKIEVVATTDDMLHRDILNICDEYCE